MAITHKYKCDRCEEQYEEWALLLNHLVVTHSLDPDEETEEIWKVMWGTRNPNLSGGENLLKLVLIKYDYHNGDYYCEYDYGPEAIAQFSAILEEMGSDPFAPAKQD